MRLHEAFDSLEVMRRRLAESEIFRGYRAAPVAASAVLALAGGWMQGRLLPEPEQALPAYVALWSAVAGLSMLAALGAMWLRDHFAGPSHTRHLTWVALRQFLPGLLSGAVVTAAILRAAPESAWLLPGLWQLFFCQAVFASCRWLPRPFVAIAAFYLASGAITLTLGRGDGALSPWLMALPFGLGQGGAALLLYWTLERPHGESTEES